MPNYVGIDLGTTNSAICTFDGEEVRLYKSPEQNDVTPSAVFFDRRGNKYVGARAYTNAARNPDNAATLFKRLMGTNTPIKLPAVEKVLTPEECSAEILRTLFGYLPEEVRQAGVTGTVITVPAAFNQMQKDATLAAAELAGIGKVALMQEPVAAAMSVMRQRRGDGVFLVYDLGGGTLDVAIAESISGRVSLLAHGGIAMCGGRDFDRLLIDNVVKAWLLEHFDLPTDLTARSEFKTLMRMAAWAAEKAKIDLYSREEATISLSEAELGTRDLSGEDIYLDISITRDQFDALIKEKVTETIEATRETLEKAGLSANDVERMVFVGGPTHYKPLRDTVAFQLGIAASTDVNPMTAVAEGAAVFAESIDWSSQRRGRKSGRGLVSGGGKLNLMFSYQARTPATRAKIVIQLGQVTVDGAEFQVDCLDTGWSSGRMALGDGASVEVGLAKPGDNAFKVFVFDANGGAVALENSRLVIARTAATIDAIPASSSIGIEVLDKLGGRPVLDYLVRDGDPLPAKGRKTFKANESLRAGSTNAIHLKIWEGEIADPVSDNLPVGAMSISGRDFDSGIITAGADLICDFEVLDSGNVVLEVSVPSIGGTFHSGRNFYSRSMAQIDFSTAAKKIIEDVEAVQARVEAVADRVDSPQLAQALDKLDAAAHIQPNETDPEICKQAMDNVFEAKRLLSMARKQNFKAIRRLDLEMAADFFAKFVKEYARSTEVAAFDRLTRNAERAIEVNSKDFDDHLDQMRGMNFEVLWRQDWFVVDRFKDRCQRPHLFPDQAQFTELVAAGQAALRADDITRLRSIVVQLDDARIGAAADDAMALATNIVRG